MEFSSIENKIRSLTLSTDDSFDLNKLQSNLGYSPCFFVKGNTDNIDLQKRFQQQRLKHVLEQLHIEREDTSFSRNCLFCKKHFTGNRCLLLNHLMEQHNFVIGAPDNIVFINELLDALENMLKNLQCFYCEKYFKDWLALKEHMRKKQHKRINPNNKSFDKFYIINYLEPDKSWVEVQNEDDSFPSDGDEKEMDVEWQDEKTVYVCLFCDHKLFDFEETLLHMKNAHQFDFKDLKMKHGLSFYSQIKFINYIRRKVFQKECIICDLKFLDHTSLLQHMSFSGHISILPDQSKWDQPMFYFSTFENDNLLCALDVEDSDHENENIIFPEEPVLPTSTVLLDRDIRKELL